MRYSRLFAAIPEQEKGSEEKFMSTEKLYQVISETLKSIPVGEYTSEEKQLQPYLESEISKILMNIFPEEYEIKMSVGGQGRPKVDLLGTNFWPDIEISKEGKPLLAIEVKLVRKSLATAVSSAIGQCLIYKLKYEYVIGFIRNQVQTYPKYNEFNEQFWQMLERLKLELIIRSVF